MRPTPAAVSTSAWKGTESVAGGDLVVDAVEVAEAVTAGVPAVPGAAPRGGADDATR
jgi:hypothetical protein